MLVLYCYPCYGLAWQDLGAVSCNIGQIVKPLMYPHVFLVPLVRSVDVWKTSLPLFMSRNLMLSNWLTESQKVLAMAVFCFFNHCILNNKGFWDSRDLGAVYRYIDVSAQGFSQLKYVHCLTCAKKSCSDYLSILKEIIKLRVSVSSFTSTVYVLA